MQLEGRGIIFSQVALLALTQSLVAENYIAIEYLQYNESDDRVAVSAPSFTMSYDIGVDYNIKADFFHDAVSGATPVWKSTINRAGESVQPDSDSGASKIAKTLPEDFYYGKQNFEEERNAGSLMFTSRFSNRDELYVGGDYSTESDFESKTASLDYMHYTDKSHNCSLNLGGSFTYNKIKTFDSVTGASKKEASNSTSFNIQGGINQVLSENSVVKLDTFAVVDSGYLTNPHGRVVRYYDDKKFRNLTNENRPDNRLAYGLDFKYITLLGENISYKVDYRFYTDDWDIDSHTVDNDILYEINNKLILGLGLRYYTQTEASFYNRTKDFFTSQEFASSDERLSGFNALTYKGSVDYKINDKISYNLGAEYYKQSTGLEASMITTGIKYKY